LLNRAGIAGLLAAPRTQLHRLWAVADGISNVRPLTGRYSSTVERPLQVLITGKRLEDIQSVASMLSGAAQFRTSTKVIDAANAESWLDAGATVEALVVLLDHNWTEPLRVLSSRSLQQRPPLLVLGPTGNVETMRLAMQCGARDFLSTPVQPHELSAALDRIAKDRSADPELATGHLTAIINAHGGAGSSVIAVNLAHMLATEIKARTALVDLDLQFGVLPLYLDLKTNSGLVHAVESIDTLDEVAIVGWMLKHRSGLHVLANDPEQLILPGEIPEPVIRSLVSLLKRAYDQVVVDLPRQIDSTFDAVAGTAERVIVVLQQSLASLRHAKTLLMVLTGRLGLSSSQVLFIVNRWEKKAGLTLKEIDKALEGASVLTLSNDWYRVTQSLDAGTPLLEGENRATITRELLEIAFNLAGIAPGKKSLLGRLMNK